MFVTGPDSCTLDFCPLPEFVDSQSLWYLLYDPQWVDVAAYVVQQLACEGQ
jgi:hypothetical protein